MHQPTLHALSLSPSKLPFSFRGYHAQKETRHLVLQAAPISTKNMSLLGLTRQLVPEDAQNGGPGRDRYLPVTHLPPGT